MKLPLFNQPPFGRLIAINRRLAEIRRLRSAQNDESAALKIERDKLRQTITNRKRTQR